MNIRSHFVAGARIFAVVFFLSTRSARGATTNVSYGDYFFSPAAVTINVGDTVNWKPAGTDTHTLRGLGTDPICGGSLLPCSHTFTNVGTFPYLCTIPGHAQLGMVGSVIVRPAPIAPVIAAQPQSQTVITNSSATFFVVSTNATTYQWQTNMVDIPGATNSSLTLDHVVAGDSATYRVIVGNAAGTTISANAVLQVLTILPPAITLQPQSQLAITNSTVSFVVGVSNIANYQWESNTIKIPGATNASLTLSNVDIGDSGDYRVVITNVSGSVTSSTATLLVGYPANIAQEPASLDVTAGSPVAFQVQATGSPVPQYKWFFNKTILTGQTNALLALGAATANLAGAYTVLVSNAFGPQMSTSAVLTVEPLTSIIREKLAVLSSPSGSGSAIPNLNGKSLVVAHSYTVTAVAGKGQAFKYWSGVVESESPSLTFVMPSTPGAMLVANFIPSPFAQNGVAGAYSGLFWDPNKLSNETAGWVVATVSGTGVVSGRLRIAGATAPFSTTLHADGSASIIVTRRNQSSLLLALQVDLAGLETMTGTVRDLDNTFEAQLSAYRAGRPIPDHTKSYKGYYTWAMPGASGNAPGGYSYGNARVGPEGDVRFSIFLSDGSSTVATGSLSTNGLFPLYAGLNGGKGSFLSWLSFTNPSTNGAYWFKNGVTHGSYPGGFNSTNLFIWLAPYSANTNGGNALGAGSASVEVSGADLAKPVTNTITLDPNGIGGAISNFVVTMADQSGVFGGLGAGMFTGIFRNPTTGAMTRFNGAVLRPPAAGYGFFTEGNLSGAILIVPQ